MHEKVRFPPKANIPLSGALSVPQDVRDWRLPDFSGRAGPRFPNDSSAHLCHVGRAIPIMPRILPFPDSPDKMKMGTRGGNWPVTDSPFVIRPGGKAVQAR
jgi:hypothetical protein